jgi:hypothetical protein
MVAPAMIFQASRRHFFRYQKADEAAYNSSTPNKMHARVGVNSRAKLPEVGDVIWVLANLGGTPSRYRFIYAFIVGSEPFVVDGWNRFEGRDGLWLPESPLVSDLPWFKEFYDRMGRGGTSIQVMADADIERLHSLFGRHAITGATGPEELAVEAAERGWPEDAVRYGAIRSRRGQADFRSRLLEAYGRRCCVSGCRVEALLEAAHIRPHAVEPNYDTRNGLLLRADLHTLYDLHLLGVDEHGYVQLSPEVTDQYYKDLVRKAGRITPPDRSADRPSEDDRRERMKLFRRSG